MAAGQSRQPAASPMVVRTNMAAASSATGQCRNQTGGLQGLENGRGALQPHQSQHRSDQSQKPDLETNASSSPSSVSSLGHVDTSASNNTRSFGQDSDSYGSNQSAAAAPGSEAFLSPSPFSRSNTYDSISREEDVTQDPTGPSSSNYPPPLPLDLGVTSEALTRFRPTPRDIISGLAPHVFDERKRRPSQTRRPCLPSWSYYNRRPKASPLRKSVVISYEQSFHGFPASYGYFRVHGVNTRKPRDSPRPSTAPSSGTSAKPKPKSDPTGSRLMANSNTAPSLTASTAHANLRASIIDLNLDSANCTAKSSSPTVTSKWLFKMGGGKTTKKMKKRSLSLDCSIGSQVSSSFSSTTSSSSSLSSSSSSSRSSLEEDIEDVKYKGVIGLEGGVPLVRTISVATTDTTSSGGDKFRWRDSGRVFKSWMTRSKRSESAKAL